jgi:hypothetical protein
MKIAGSAGWSGRIENLLVSITCGGFPIWVAATAPQPVRHSEELLYTTLGDTKAARRGSIKSQKIHNLSVNLFNSK